MTFTPEQLQHMAAWIEHSCMDWENRTPSVSCAVAGEELCAYCIDRLLASSLRPLRTMRIVPKGSPWFGVDWHPAVWVCRAGEFTESGVSKPDADGTVAASISYRSIEPWISEPVAWWRKLGYYVMAVPLDWIAWHAWRRWRTDEDHD